MIVAFDFDGTLVDSMAALENLAVAVVQDAYPEHPEEDIRRRYRSTAGDPFYVQLTHILPVSTGYEAAHWVEIAHQFAKRKVSITEDAPLFDDVRDSLKTLHEAGHTLVVVTSSKRELVRECLVNANIYQYFAQVLGIDSGEKYQNLLTLEPRFFIGDTDRDRDHARAAKVAFAGVRRDKRLLAIADDVFIDLKAIVERIK